MKTLLVVGSIVLAGVSTAQAQIYRSAVGPAAAVGAIAGSIIGGHNHDNWAPGAIIGGMAGALFGAAVDQQQQPVYQAPAAYGQPVYSQQQGYAQPNTVAPAPWIPSAPAAYGAPVAVDQYGNPVTQVPAQVVQPAPQVVYVQQPNVVYVPAAPSVYYAPPVSFGFSYYAGPRSYGYGYSPHYYAPRSYAPVHRGGYSYGHHR